VGEVGRGGLLKINNSTLPCFTQWNKNKHGQSCIKCRLSFIYELFPFNVAWKNHIHAKFNAYYI
jgi:hypothetical protein